MFYVILQKGIQVTARREFTDYRAALCEYRRQVRNAWRRKSAYNQIQFNHCGRLGGYVLERMQYHQAGACYNLELTINNPCE